MSNNAPDYEDNLAFEPKMTWENLCEYAKNKGCDIRGDFIRSKGIAFISNNKMLASGVLTENISFERMKAIIENMYGSGTEQGK